MNRSIIALLLLLVPLPTYANVWVVQPTGPIGDIRFQSSEGQQIFSSATGGVFLDDNGVRQTAGFTMFSNAAFSSLQNAWRVSYGITNVGSTPFEFVTRAEYPQFGVVLPGESKSFEGLALRASTGGMGTSFFVQWDGLSAQGAMVSASGLVPEPATLALVSLGLMAMAGAQRRKGHGTERSASPTD